RPQPGNGGRCRSSGRCAGDDFHRRLLKEQRTDEQRRFHSLAGNHQQGKEEDAGERSRSGFPRRGGQTAFDVALDPARGQPHVDRQRRDEDGGGDFEDTLPERMIGGALKEQRGANTDENRKTDAPVDGRHELVASALAQIRKADRHDQKRFEPLAERDHKRLEHESNQDKMRSNLRMTGSVYFAISDRSSRQWGLWSRNATFCQPSWKSSSVDARDVKAEIGTSPPG